MGNLGLVTETFSVSIHNAQLRRQQMAKFLGIFLVVLTVLIVFDVGPLYAQEAEAEINPDCDPFLGGLASFMIPGGG